MLIRMQLSFFAFLVLWPQLWCSGLSFGITPGITPVSPEGPYVVLGVKPGSVMSKASPLPMVLNLCSCCVFWVFFLWLLGNTWWYSGIIPVFAFRNQSLLAVSGPYEITGISPRLAHYEESAITRCTFSPVLLLFFQ